MKTPGERIKYWVESVYRTKTEFAKDMGFTSQVIHSYLGEGKKSVFGKKYQNKLQELGLNIVWYIHGEGTMFSDSEKGKELAKKFTQYNIPDSDFITANETGVKYIRIPNLTNLTANEIKELFDILDEEKKKLSDVLKPFGLLNEENK